MVTRIDLGSIRVDVVRKEIKNIHLGVYPPSGKVRISAPVWMELDAIRLFAINKLAWIKQQQRKLRAQERETPREYLERESHYVWGKRYLMQIIEREAKPSVELTHRHLRLQVRPGTDASKREELLADWYRDQLKRAVPALLAKWEPIIGVRVTRFYVQRMKTKWGSCNAEARNIRFNTELAKKPPECLEYIVVHELVHLLEPTHNDRFVAWMNKLMPHWRDFRDMLNRLPVRNEHWHY
ncbi:MAG TPA: SprT family zinc-dependent metalloprotease [Dokdonella sp.]|uniref:M48 family metallopeptidase n=1 Tax=Dokdonella sp. TaxID=2291710 RepID=UPI002D7F16B9|nr:SprT family zinc-dependent metalloprotease [Dokdonella sp.]HET9034219.1 SprT family zinc-dependent metalloprotease [Dokdonella sp.]